MARMGRFHLVVLPGMCGTSKVSLKVSRGSSGRPTTRKARNQGAEMAPLEPFRALSHAVMPGASNIYDVC